jgi:hypothetical protein
MNTKYGQISDNHCNSYKTELTNKIFKILPLKENDCETIEMYVESIIYELCGANYIFYSNGKLISLISLLEMIKQEQNHSIYKQKIFQCTNDIIPSLFGEGDLIC